MEDAALVRAARANPQDFGPLYERYLGPVYRYCYVRLNNRELAEDATSEIFLKALANLPSYRNGVFAAWLFRIAQNVVVDVYRQSARTRTVAADDETGLLHVGGDFATACAEREALAKAFAALTDEQRSVLELQLAGWTTMQIADALGKSLAAVKMLRYRAVEQMRMILLQDA